MAVLEIKDSMISEAVVEIVREMNVLEQIVIISFHISVLQTVRQLEPRIPTGYLIGSNNDNMHPIQLCQQVSSLGSGLLNVNHHLITAEFAHEVCKRGISLWSWTVDDVDQMRKMLACGVQGITSNHPDRFSVV